MRRISTNVEEFNISLYEILFTLIHPFMDLRDTMVTMHLVVKLWTKKQHSINRLHNDFHLWSSATSWHQDVIQIQIKINWMKDTNTIWCPHYKSYHAVASFCPTIIGVHKRTHIQRLLYLNLKPKYNCEN